VAISVVMNFCRNEKTSVIGSIVTYIVLFVKPTLLLVKQHCHFLAKTPSNKSLGGRKHPHTKVKSLMDNVDPN
jgi:hypothetical protein